MSTNIMIMYRTCRNTPSREITRSRSVLPLWQGSTQNDLEDQPLGACRRQKMGRVRLFSPLSPEEEEWLCPSCDPMTRSLRFRRRNGQDVPRNMELCTLAQSEIYRPLLVMAHADGLLDNIPGASRRKITSLGVFNEFLLFYRRCTSIPGPSWLF